MKGTVNKQDFLTLPPRPALSHPAANCIALYDEVGNAAAMLLGVPGWENA